MQIFNISTDIINAQCSALSPTNTTLPSILYSVHILVKKFKQDSMYSPSFTISSTEPGTSSKRWPSLTRYCEDGRLNIDNSPAERCIRPITIGRKNWVFAGSDLAAERAAIIYSLVETCKLNKVDPFAYFTDVLDRIAEHPNKNIDELLPFNWKPIKKVPHPY